MEDKKRTIDIIKQKRMVPEAVLENRKKFIGMKKAILEVIKDEAKTIPQIASETNYSLSETTYYLMTLQKFGDVIVDSLDDIDEYYLYKKK